ncbi:MAG: alpha/beta hydrolase [Sciscionella sp.]|nr:alpha/beta hydrolase [Sciscionella sp.]
MADHRGDERVRTSGYLTGGAGARLAYLAAGRPDVPALVLLHGWGSSADVWEPLLDGPLAERFSLLALDLRGHGRSDKPASGYADAQNWAADVRAALEHVGGLGGSGRAANRPAIVVGWSYGGLVITDYLRAHGVAHGLAGIVLVGAITEIGRGHPGGWVGPALRAALPDALAEDEGVAIKAIGEFGALADDELDPATAQAIAGDLLRVPPAVRAALFARDVDSADVLASVGVPALIVHGSDDPVVDMRAAQYAARQLPKARLHRVDGAGHLPFLSHRDEFTDVLAAFADEVFDG